MSKKKRKQWKKKHREHSTAPYVAPPTMNHGWESSKVDASVHCPPIVYTDASAWLASEPVAEIAGFGVVEDGCIVWMCKTSSGKGGGVTSMEDEMHAALEMALAEGHDTINLQWHTHPGLSAFWSVTDSNAQLQMVNSAVACSSSGHMYFLVFDWGDWLVRRVEWNDGVIEYGDTYITIGSEATKLEGYHLRYYQPQWDAYGAQRDVTNSNYDTAHISSLVEAFDSNDTPRFEELAAMTDLAELEQLGRTDVYAAVERVIQEEHEDMKLWWEEFGWYDDLTI